MSSRPVAPTPKGFRRVERWAVGIVMSIVAIVLERIVMRSVERGGKQIAVEPEPTTLTSKGGEVDLPS
ncbi:MAG: hypothetical protein ACXVWF_08645 [Actinomycetota bacterium]